MSDDFNVISDDFDIFAAVPSDYDLYSKIKGEVTDNVMSTRPWNSDELMGRIKDARGYFAHRDAIIDLCNEVADATTTPDNDLIKVTLRSAADAVMLFAPEYTPENVGGLAYALNVFNAVKRSAIKDAEVGDAEMVIDLSLTGEQQEAEIRRNINILRRNRSFELKLDASLVDWRKATTYLIALVNVAGEYVRESNGNAVDCLAFLAVKHYLDMATYPFAPASDSVERIKNATRIAVSLLSI